MASKKLSREERQQLHYVAKRVRIAYPHVFEPQTPNFQGDDDTPKAPAWSLQVRLDPNNDHDKQVIADIEALMQRAAKIYWEKDAETALRIAKRQDTTCFIRESRDGTYLTFNVKRVKRDATTAGPRVVGPQKQALKPEDGLIYSGMVGNVVFDMWCFGDPQGKFKPGFAAELMGLQFVSHGDPIGGGTVSATDDDFEDLSDAGDGDGEDWI